MSTKRVSFRDAQNLADATQSCYSVVFDMDPAYHPAVGSISYFLSPTSEVESWFPGAILHPNPSRFIVATFYPHPKGVTHGQ